MAMMDSGHSNSDLMYSIHVTLHDNWISTFAVGFTYICMTTSFLSLSLCLTDFLSDALGITKQGTGRAKLTALTLLPPLVVVLFYPGIFLTGLRYVGLCCVILLMLLPCLMVFRHRYILNNHEGYHVSGGKLPLLIVPVIAMIIIIFNLLQDLHVIH
jgi:tyrosine-specific transport protein